MPFTGREGFVYPFARASLWTLRGVFLLTSVVLSGTALAQSGPVGYWKLDETSGTSVSDSSGGAHTGTFVNSPAWTTGRVNGALSFTTSNAAVSVPGTGNLTNLYTTGMTVSVWIRPTSAGGGGQGAIVHKNRWSLAMNSTSTVKFTASQFPTAATRVSTAVISLNTWKHVAVTWNGSTSGTGIQIYVNGAAANGTSTNGSGSASSDAADNLFLGNRADLARAFAGALDEVRVYNRILTLAEIQALADSTAPSVPGSPAATAVSSSQINVSWNASTDNVGVTGYRVERCQGSGCTTWAQVATPTASPFNDTGRNSSTTYRYRIRANDANQNLSGYSAIVSATTPMADTQPPTVPTNVTASVQSSTQIVVTWTPSTDNVAVVNYPVERCAGVGCSNFVQIGAPAGAMLNDEGLTPATSYSYRVRAADAVPNFSAYSSIQTATTQAPPDTSPPTAPGAPSGTVVSSSQINLTWAAATDNVGVTAYLLERCQGTSCTDFSEIISVATTSHGDTGLSGNTAYRYRVRAKDAANNIGPYSAISNFTTSAAGTAGNATCQYDSFGRLKQVTVTPQ